MRRVAIIDLGTNSVRFDVHEFGDDGESRLLHREKLMVRLGQEAFSTGRLEARAIERTLDGLRYFSKRCREFRVDRIISFGTSAVRDSKNGLAFVKRVKRETGLAIEVISGEQEARLIALGILNREQDSNDRFALVDIGGGSTEISICENHRILASASFPLGTARLQEVYLQTVPPRPDRISEMRRAIRATLLSKMLAEEWPRAKRMIGSSGTVKAFQRMIRQDSGDRIVTRKKLDQWIDRISQMRIEEIFQIKGLEAKRADMILAGGILLQECMDVLKIKRVTSTDYSLRDGILDSERALIIRSPGQNSSQHREHLKIIRTHAQKNPDLFRHAEQVRKLALQLFDHLKSAHRLSPRERNRLELAALLHDEGQLVHATQHATHSYYMAKHLDVPGWSDEEREFVALLCLYHADEKFNSRALQHFKTKSQQRAFAATLGLLQVADALDRGHKQTIQSLKIKNVGKKVSLSFRTAKGLGDLERLRADQKRAWFEISLARDLLLKELKPS